MRQTGIILLIFLGTVSALHAQEHRNAQEHRAPLADSAARGWLAPLPQKLTVDWLREEVDPITRERRKIHQLMEQRAQKSVLQQQAIPSQKEAADATGTWRMTIGNTSVNNWSPFPDRALDARVIRFPLPRNMQPDKRPESMKRLDKLKK